MTDQNNTAPHTQDDEAETQSFAENSDSLPENGPSETQRLESELANMRDQALRALAELENTRKRALKDREDASKYAVANFARDLLDIADTFRRALDSIPADLRDTDPRVASLLDGITATETKMLDTFARHGIKRIDPNDVPFDPNFHEVMFEVPHTGKPQGTVIQVIECGYILNDRLLRPARVGVAKGDAADHTLNEEV
ncbi:MAG: nucleotide exchange factor GrpE [Pseudomonadota bacterium]